MLILQSLFFRTLTREFLKPLTREFLKPLTRDFLKPLTREFLKPLTRDFLKPLTREFLQPLTRNFLKPLTIYPPRRQLKRAVEECEARGSGRVVEATWAWKGKVEAKKRVLSHDAGVQVRDRSEEMEQRIGQET
eukprot:COSAG02_NODE_9783_length_2111_cov_2.254970_2_plen_134_part_00